MNAPGRQYDTISFLSDFGHADEFVGVVHSVIRSIAPQVGVVDVTHGIAKFDTRAGGLALARAANYLNPGIVIAVVDPGVGTDRRPVALEVGDGMSLLIGPDNGLLAPAVGLVGGATRAVHLTNEDYQLPRSGGATFDGRDIFAPAAAHLANGVPITELGPEIDPATLLPGVLPISRFESGEHGQELVCEVLWVDHYGNCQLNVDPLELLSITDSPGGEVMVTIGAGSATPDERVGVRVDAYDQIRRAASVSSWIPAVCCRSRSRVARRLANSSSARASSCGSVISIRPTGVPASARRYSSVPAPPEDSDARKYHAGDRHPAARHPRRSGVAVRLAGRLRRRPTSGPTRRFSGLSAAPKMVRIVRGIGPRTCQDGPL